MTVTPTPPEPEELGYDKDDTPPVLREEDPNIEAKLDEIFAAPPSAASSDLEDF